jgi:hypothetical protein
MIAPGIDLLLAELVFILTDWSASRYRSAYFGIL